MSQHIPYGKQNITQGDIDAVVSILKGPYLTQGPAVPMFESEIAHKAGVKHAVAANSATSALHLACLALGAGPSDKVWTSSTTFVASANCARYCGAQIDFVDISAKTGLMSMNCLRSKLADAASTGTLPKVVIPVHLCGSSCDMAEVGRLGIE